MNFKLSDTSTTDIPGLINVVAQSVCGTNCVAPSRIPSSAIAISNVGVCQLAVAISSTLAMQVTFPLNDNAQKCQAAIQAATTACVVPGSGQGYYSGIIGNNQYIAELGPLNDNEFMAGYINPSSALLSA